MSEIFNRIMKASRMPKKYSWHSPPPARDFAGNEQYGSFRRSKIRGSKMKQTTVAMASAISAFASRSRSSRRCSVSDIRLSSTVLVRRNCTACTIRRGVGNRGTGGDSCSWTRG